MVLVMTTATPTHEFEFRASDADYPAALSAAHPPVRQLFCKGSESLLRQVAQNPGLAIVGSRQASSQGIADARWFARRVSEAGLTVISGLAQGIDAAAHEGALQGAGKTIAVLGHGRDTIYPPMNRPLAKNILAEGGTLVTEYPDQIPALPRHFPHRNRIVAGLARAVLVIEAVPSSGSLITARHALDLGIDVFVVPGSIHAPQSLGCNMLIRQGANLTQSPDQLLEDLGIIAPTPVFYRHKNRAQPSRQGVHSKSKKNPEGSAPLLQHCLGDELTAETALVLSYLDFQPTTVEQLKERSQFETGALYANLLMLELCGQATRLADGRWLKHRVL